MPLRQVRRLQRASDYDSTAHFAKFGEPVEAETEREAIELVGFGHGYYYTARVADSEDDPGAPPIFTVSRTGELVEGD